MEENFWNVTQIINTYLVRPINGQEQQEIDG